MEESLKDLGAEILKIKETSEDESIDGDVEGTVEDAAAAAAAVSDDDEEKLEDPDQLTDVQEIDIINKKDREVMNLEQENSNCWSQIKKLRKEKNELKKKMNGLAKSNEDLNKEKMGLLVQIETEVKRKDSLMKKLTDAVTCCVCLNVPRGNRIPVCNNGHIYCSDCKLQGEGALTYGRGMRCPVCRDYTWEERYSQIALNVSDLLEIDCANQPLGCKVRLKKSLLVAHEEDCAYAQNLDCPNDRRGCRVKISYTDCIEHLTNKCTFGDELRMVEMGKTKSFRLSMEGEDLYEHCAITSSVKDTSDYVIVFGDTSPTDDHVRIGVKCLSPDKTFRYKVDMKLMDKSTKQSKINSGETLLMTEDMEAGIEAGNVLEVNSKTYRRFLLGDCKFYFTLRAPEPEPEKDDGIRSDDDDDDMNPPNRLSEEALRSSRRQRERRRYRTNLLDTYGYEYFESEDDDDEEDGIAGFRSTRNRYDRYRRSNSPITNIFAALPPLDSEIGSASRRRADFGGGGSVDPLAERQEERRSLRERIRSNTLRRPAASAASAAAAAGSAALNSLSSSSRRPPLLGLLRPPWDEPQPSTSRAFMLEDEEEDEEEARRMRIDRILERVSERVAKRERDDSPPPDRDTKRRR